MKKQQEKPRVGRPGYSGSSTSNSLYSEELVSFHDSIPEAARMPLQSSTDTLWVNNKGEVKPRQVIGDKVLIRQQPASPPPQPQILVLTDQMCKKFHQDDRYIKVIAMVGYTLNDYINDIKDSMIQVVFPYVMVFMGSMQLGLFDPETLQSQVTELVRIIMQITPNTMVVFSGLVPHPLDHDCSAKRCKEYSQSYVEVTKALRHSKGWNCTSVLVFHEFLDDEGNIDKADTSFEQGIYLTQNGYRVLRAAWLRYLGFFLKKAQKVCK